MFKLSNIGRQAWVGHVYSKKRRDVLDRRQSFFKPRETTMHNAQQEKTFSNGNVQMVDLTMHNSARRKAEILWSLKSVSSGFSNNSATSNINQVFAAMFPDSKIAKSFQVAVPYWEFFGAYGYMYRDWDFNKSILSGKKKSGKSD